MSTTLQLLLSDLDYSVWANQQLLAPEHAPSLDIMPRYPFFGARICRKNEEAIWAMQESKECR
jgi:hypothetical protein